MTTISNSRPTRVDEVYAQLRGLATGPGLAVGDRLQPVRTLARQLGASVPTIQRAMARLEAEGVLQRRHGSGTFVASPHVPVELRQAVALCMEPGTDVFGELAACLMQRLQEQQRFVSLLDTRAPAARQMLLALSHSAVGCLVVHGHLHFPFEVFTDPAFRRKPIIGVIDWETQLDLPDVVQVLSDYAAGARLAADHLWALGHRRVLIVGTTDQIHYLHHPSPQVNPLQCTFATHWAALGGTWRTLASEQGATGDRLPLAELLGACRGAGAVTAIFGLRDCEAHQAQRLLLQHLPEVAARLAIVGYYDTPWASFGQPPITAMNLDVPAIGAAVLAVLGELPGRRGQGQRIIRVPPRLIVRGTSRPVGGVSTP